MIRRGLLALSGAAVLAGVVFGLVALLTETPEERVAERFGSAWAAGDYGAMYELLTPASREDIGPQAFEDAYLDAAATATATAFDPGEARVEDEVVVLPVTATTAVWGQVSGEVTMRLAGERVGWAPDMVFPGLREGEELDRRTRAPERAAILARDGTVLAEGEAGKRRSELGFDAGTVTGTIAPPATGERARSLYERGFDRYALTGTTGLELVFEREVAGTPGGVLLAGDRELARSTPQPGPAVRTTIDPGVQAAAVGALDPAGGIAVLDARGGQVRALAGLALIGPQPPGSTFKIVTTTAALEAGTVKPSTEFPVTTGATIEGRTISNADDAACGGSFSQSFARSCNSVFAPLGVEVGAEKLVETAERFGLNMPPAIPGAETSTIPPADDIASDLELGATAIGQGRLLVTPLRLASISQTIAADGTLTEPRVAAGAPPERRRVTSRRVADTVEELMVGVTEPGATGDAAALPGVEVAGKTGTAELGEDVTEHAWFTAFAPAGRRPELAIAVMIANGGSGGEVAAPVARTVLQAGL
ncbi:MAG TPA: penicillin-binding transpeptidase domain-containing protein [Thermoleophilaceae bacterium]|nr:penicillin-binding transpeptidase domain-containing protein [Thermoleophilaceae bacterium]